jgi:tRNA nucleotidyltransferase (CCA-adding enzyme)
VRDEVATALFRRLAHKVDLELLARVAKSDCEGASRTLLRRDGLVSRAGRALGVQHRPPAPMLLGRHLIALGLRPGPRVGEILKAVYEQQMDGSVRDLDEAIEAAKRLL